MEPDGEPFSKHNRSRSMTVGRAVGLGTAVMAMVFAGMSAARSSGAPRNGSQRTRVMSTKEYRKPPEAELKKTLTPAQFEVTQKAGTEPPFRNEFWNNHEPGLYVDVATGEPLFSSLDKFDSGTGWPSFTQPVEPNRVLEERDATHGMVRTEVKSRGGRIAPRSRLR